MFHKIFCWSLNVESISRKPTVVLEKLSASSVYTFKRNSGAVLVLQEYRCIRWTKWLILLQATDLRDFLSKEEKFLVDTVLEDSKICSVNSFGSVETIAWISSTGFWLLWRAWQDAFFQRCIHEKGKFISIHYILDVLQNEFWFFETFTANV